MNYNENMHVCLLQLNFSFDFFYNTHNIYFDILINHSMEGIFNGEL